MWIVLLFIATINVQRVLSTVPPDSADKPEICITAGCVKAAANLLESIDFSKNPCDNFFDFACGNWVKKNRIPDDKSRYDTFTKVAELITERFRSLLEDLNATRTNSRAINYVFDIYQKCMDKATLDVIKSSPLQNYLAVLGGWPLLSPDWDPSKIDLTDLTSTAMSQMASDTLLQLSVQSDVKNVTKHIVTFDQMSLGLGYGTRDFYLNDNNFGKLMRAYKKFIFDTAKTLAGDMGLKNFDEKRLQLDVEKIVDFEKQIANFTLAEQDRRNATLLYNKWVLSDFDKLLTFMNLSRFAEKVLPAEVFQRLIRGKMDRFEVIVKVPGYFEQFNNLILNTDKRTVVNFAVWLVVKTSISQLDTRYEDIAQEFYKVYVGKQEKVPRWKTCIAAATGSMSKASGSLYVRHFFSAQDEKSARRMIENLRDSFKNLLKENEWMDTPTKKVAFKKLDNMIEIIGYPDYAFNDTALDKYFENLTIAKNESYFGMLSMIWRSEFVRATGDLLKSLDRKRFVPNPAIVNAMYTPEKNTITFPAGILQPPFFHNSYPEFVNYGAIGSIIGHEITHGFDDIGRQYDKLGNLFDWWSQIATEKFLIKKKCIIDQYSGFLSKDVNKTVNGLLTQGENVADNGGVKQSFNAYKRYISKRGSAEPVLPGMNLTAEQTFFASYAQFWCGKLRPAARVKQILTDPHSPEVFRVNGPLANLEAFARVFHCATGSPMNPHVRCSVW